MILERAASGIVTGTGQDLHQRRFIVRLLLSLAALVMPARAENRQREFVPEINAFFKHSNRTRLFLLGKGARLDYFIIWHRPPRAVHGVYQIGEVYARS